MPDPSGTWSTVAQTTTERWEGGVVALNDKIYVLGGGRTIGGQPNSPLAQEFDPATGRWRDLAPLPQGASHLDAITLNGKIYVAGGFSWSNHRNPLDLFLEYDPATDHWKPLARLSSPRGSVSLVAVGGMIHAIGGTGGDFRPVAPTKSSIPRPQHGHRPRLSLPRAIIWEVSLRLTGSSTSSAAAGPVPLPRALRCTMSMIRLRIHGHPRHPCLPPAAKALLLIIMGLVLYFGGDCNDPNAAGAFDYLQAYDPTTDSWKPLA